MGLAILGSGKALAEKTGGKDWRKVGSIGYVVRIDFGGWKEFLSGFATIAARMTVMI